MALQWDPEAQIQGFCGFLGCTLPNRHAGVCSVQVNGRRQRGAGPRKSMMRAIGKLKPRRARNAGGRANQVGSHADDAPPIETFRSCAAEVAAQPHALSLPVFPPEGASQSALTIFDGANLTSAPIFDELEHDEDAIVPEMLDGGDVETEVEAMVSAGAAAEEDEEMAADAVRLLRPAESSEEEASPTSSPAGAISTASDEEEGSNLSEIMLMEEEVPVIAGAVRGLPRTPHFKTVAAGLGALHAAAASVLHGAAQSVSGSADVPKAEEMQTPTSPHMRIRAVARQLVAQLSKAERAWVEGG